MDIAYGGGRVSGGDGNGGSGGDDGLLVELARRLLSHRYPGDPGAETARLLPGEVPAEVLAEVPLPEEKRIIGSMVLPTHITVVLESSMKPDRVEAFYKERMLAAGWTEPEPWPGMRQGGFETSFMSQAFGTVFCRGPRGPELRIEAFPVEDGPTDVRLYHNTDARSSICAQQRKMRGMRMDVWSSIIPSLSAPSGTWQMLGNSGSGGSGDDYHTSASLRSDLDLAAVANH